VTDPKTILYMAGQREIKCGRYNGVNIQVAIQKSDDGIDGVWS
jgi:hypothetical protein